MSILPHFSSESVSTRKVLIDRLIPTQEEEIVIDSSNTDSGSTPTYRFRAGNVVVKRTSTGRYVEANDTNADVSTAATITSSGHTDATDVIKLVGNHGTISVTVSTGTGTEANCATDLNADSDFAAHYTASSSGGELTITSNEVGDDEWFYIHSDTHANYGFSEGTANGVTAGEPDVWVTLANCDLELDGTAVHAGVLATRVGHFDESNHTNLTAEAKAVLIANGSKFG